MKSIFIAATIAAACSGVALAGDPKQDQKTVAPAVKAQVMSDSEMEKVTAGFGFGTDTAAPHSLGPTTGLAPHAIPNAQSPGQPGFGNCTGQHGPGVGLC